MFSFQQKRPIAGSIFVLVIVLVAVVMFSGGATQAKMKTVNMPIVLFTDFGTESYLVSELKGIIYSTNYDARVVEENNLSSCLVSGELSLDGIVRKVKQVN